MKENWMEEIKRNDGMTMLNRYFPGKSCGDPECENHCIELCRIAERIGGLAKDEIVSAVASRLVFPETCPALESQLMHNYCRFLVFFNDRITAYDDRTGRKIIGKKYISDTNASKSGACKKCLEYANRVFKWPEEADKMQKLPLHPNCKCHYEDVYEEKSQQSGGRGIIRDAMLASNKNLSMKDAEKLESLIVSADRQMRKYTRGKEVYLYFNGRYLFSNNGRLVLDAVSGKPVAVKTVIQSINEMYTAAKSALTFDYSKQRQTVENKGGLPEGIYWFKCKESGSLLNGNINKHALKMALWGMYHWILHPLPKTNTYGRRRNSFTIHGGKYFDSGGCIDLRENDVILRKYLQEVRQTYMFVFVEYDQRQVTVMEETKSLVTIHP